MATTRPQSLAEHSFNVAQIALEILRRLGEPENWAGQVALLALDHDLDEIFYGDIPSQAKEKPPYDWSVTLRPAMIVKMADIIDMYTYIHAYRADRHGKQVTHYVYHMYKDMVDELPAHIWPTVASVCDQILSGEYRI